MCVCPCPCCLTGGDTHIICVACLGEDHAQSALESAGCEHCNMLPLRTLRSRLAFFREDAQARIPQGSGPAAAEGTAKAAILGFANGSVSGGRDGHCLISPAFHLTDFSASYQGWEARAAFFPSRLRANTLQISDSEELDAANDKRY